MISTVFILAHTYLSRITGSLVEQYSRRIYNILKGCLDYVAEAPAQETLGQIYNWSD